MLLEKESHVLEKNKALIGSVRLCRKERANPGQQPVPRKHI